MYKYQSRSYRDIIYDFISQYHPPPPQTTAIYRDFKKSTTISKGYNVGLRYINGFELTMYEILIRTPLVTCFID
jgi:hypothetical protein